jgi:hypothetical protein
MENRGANKGLYLAVEVSTTGDSCRGIPTSETVPDEPALVESDVGTLACD